MSSSVYGSVAKRASPSPYWYTVSGCLRGREGGLVWRERRGGRGYIAATCGYISATSRLRLGCISATSGPAGDEDVDADVGLESLQKEGAVEVAGGDAPLALAQQLLGQLWAGAVEADAAPAVRGCGLDDPDGLWVGA